MTTWTTTQTEVTWTAVDDPSVTWTVQVGGTSGGGGGATNLDGLTDVVITAAASGDILRHNGTNWVDTPGTDHFEAAGAVAAHTGDTVDAHDASAISIGTLNGNLSAVSGTDVEQALQAVDNLSLGGTVDVVSNVATNTILGRTTAGSGNSEELTASQVRTLLKTPQSSDDTVLDIRVMTQAAYDAITPSSTTIYFISG